MKYIKFDYTGKHAIEAPKKIKTLSGWIFGYNSPANEEKLFADRIFEI